jgi:hypothetical protein
MHCIALHTLKGTAFIPPPRVGWWGWEQRPVSKGHGEQPPRELQVERVVLEYEGLPMTLSFLVFCSMHPLSPNCIFQGPPPYCLLCCALLPLCFCGLHHHRRHGQPAFPHPTAAQPIWLQHIPGQLDVSNPIMLAWWACTGAAQEHHRQFTVLTAVICTFQERAGSRYGRPVSKII